MNSHLTCFENWVRGVMVGIITICVIPSNSSTAQPLQPLSESTNSISAVYALTKSAKKYDDFQQISQRCRAMMQRDDLTEKDHTYLNSLVGWAENRMAGKELDNAIGLASVNLEEQAEQELRKAIARYDGLINSHPKLWRAWMGRAVIHARQGEFEIALEKFRQVLKLDVKNLSARFNCAEILYHLKDYKKALAEYSKVIIDNSADVQALTGRGHCYLKLKQYAKATDDFETVTKLLPDNQSAVANLKIANNYQLPKQTLTSAKQ